MLYILLPIIYPYLSKKWFITFCMVLIILYGVLIGPNWKHTSLSYSRNLYDITNIIKKNGKANLILFGEDLDDGQIGSIMSSGVPVLLNAGLFRVIYYKPSYTPVLIKEAKIIYNLNLEEKYEFKSKKDFDIYIENTLKNMSPEHLRSIKKEYPMLKYLVYPAKWSINDNLPVTYVYGNNLANIYEINEGY